MLRTAAGSLLGSLTGAAAQPSGAAQVATYSAKAFTATLFPGDGVGPEIADSVKKVFSAAGVPVTWDEQHISKTVDPRTNSMVTRENLDSVKACWGNLHGGAEIRHNSDVKESPGGVQCPIGSGA